MRLLFVRPPRLRPGEGGLAVPPLGLAWLAAVAREQGHDVRILDAWALGMTWHRYSAELARLHPDVVGVTAMTPTASAAARAVRLARPHARHLVLGGPHPTATGTAVFDELPELDAAVSGEGEAVLAPLLAWLGSRSAPPPGVLAPGHPFVAGPRPDVHALPSPARDLLPRGAYRYPLASHPRFATAVTSRGCPFSCSFCDKGVGGSRWRARSPEHVVDELAALCRDGVRFVNFYDDNFTLRRERVARICELLLARRLPLRWKCEGRVDGVDPALLRLMARAGCDCIAYGVESANPASLRLLRKHASPETARRAFAWTRAAGIRTLAYLILGVPGESEADVRATVSFALDIGADYAQFSSLAALPGTPLARQVPAASVANPLDADSARPTLTDLPQETLERLVREAWSRFYLRPGPLLRLSRDAVRSGALVESARLAGRWLRWRGATRSAPAGAA